MGDRCAPQRGYRKSSAAGTTGLLEPDRHLIGVPGFKLLGGGRHTSNILPNTRRARRCGGGDLDTQRRCDRCSIGLSGWYVRRMDIFAGIGVVQDKMFFTESVPGAVVFSKAAREIGYPITDVGCGINRVPGKPDGISREALRTGRGKGNGVIGRSRAAVDSGHAQDRPSANQLP